ncbi:MAG: transposase, partial [Thiomargarita sp.]|nr:transposase [Thiomargarita sp.]
KLLEEIKKSSSKWMTTQHTICQNFSWQAGYGAFSLGESQLNKLINYIDKQHEHHKTHSFKDEFLDILKKYDIDYDKKYIWN